MLNSGGLEITQMTPTTKVECSLIYTSSIEHCPILESINK